MALLPPICPCTPCSHLPPHPLNTPGTTHSRCLSLTHSLTRPLTTHACLRLTLGGLSVTPTQPIVHFFQRTRRPHPAPVDSGTPWPKTSPHHPFFSLPPRRLFLSLPPSTPPTERKENYQVLVPFARPLIQHPIPHPRPPSHLSHFTPPLSTIQRYFSIFPKKPPWKATFFTFLYYRSIDFIASATPTPNPLVENGYAFANSSLSPCKPHAATC